MPKNIGDLKQKASKVFHYVKTIQIDLMDGEYVEGKTWPFFPKDKQDVQGFLNGKSLPFSDKVNYELDLMVLNPMVDIKKYQAMRPKRIIFHARSLESISNFIEKINAMEDFREEVEVGVAVNVAENLDFVDELVRNVDFVQFMGIETIGKQGESFSENVFSQIKNLKEKYPNVIISVDGGISLENAKTLKDLGVDRIVSGSFIFKSENPEEAINQLKNA